MKEIRSGLCYNNDIVSGLYNRDSTNNALIQKIRKKILYNIYVKTIIVTTLVVIVFYIKSTDKISMKESNISKILVNEYNKNYSYRQINTSVKTFFREIYKVITPIIPNDIEELFKTKNTSGKKNIGVYKEVNVYEEKKPVSDSGKGSMVEDEKTNVTATSSISTEDTIVKKIKQTMVKFIIPAKGIISSRFGDREEIFSGIGTYHTGVDIANDKGTEIYSSIAGKVTAADYNKYNGNYVEVTNGKIVTKYCHMQKRLVKVGEKVKAGTRIGLMGSTGLSTGPHLHFEIVYDGTKVDPEKILEL